MNQMRFRYTIQHPKALLVKPWHIA